MLKISSHKSFRKRKVCFISEFKVQWLMEGKSKPRELDTVGHVAFAVKKQRSMNVCMPTQFSLSLYMTQGSLPGDDHASNLK